MPTKRPKRRRRAAALKPQPKPEPWEQQPKEGASAYLAFKTYRDMEPAERSIRQVAVVLHRNDALMFGWSVVNQWQTRVHYFDAANDRKAQLTLQKERLAMVQRHSRQAQLLQAKALEALQKIEPDMLTTTDLLRWLETGMRMERATKGEPDREDAAKNAYQALWERLGGPELEAAESAL